jgi:hypothetical protein
MAGPNQNSNAGVYNSQDAVIDNKNTRFQRRPYIQLQSSREIVVAGRSDQRLSPSSVYPSFFTEQDSRTDINNPRAPGIKLPMGQSSVLSVDELDGDYSL